MLQMDLLDWSGGRQPTKADNVERFTLFRASREQGCPTERPGGRCDSSDIMI
jgi:hypothetical protein